MHSISDMLKRRRLEIGMTLAQVARRSDTSISALSRYENGWRRFGLATLEKIATALGCRLSIELVPIARHGPGRLIKSAAETVRQIARLFWDRRLRTADLEEYPRWIVQRVLEYGALADVRALIGFMGRRRFLKTVAACRFSTRRTAVFWENVLKREMPECMKKHYRPGAGSCWIV